MIYPNEDEFMWREGFREGIAVAKKIRDLLDLPYTHPSRNPERRKQDLDWANRVIAKAEKRLSEQDQGKIT